jgi:pyrroloquinoline quinone (PQQ) biosynthesis protein C
MTESASVELSRGSLQYTGGFSDILALAFSPLRRILDMVLDPDFFTKHAEGVEKHAKEASAWVMKGMKDDSEKAEKK